MNQITIIIAFLGILFSSCNFTSKPNYEIAGEQSELISTIIDAVNEKNAEKYVEGFAENIQIFVGTEMKIEGKENLKINRANHFKNHPNVRSEIQHLVEIDNKVIMHDKVWLDNSDNLGQNIVEIFTFKNGEISRVDVIQPNDLFQN